MNQFSKARLILFGWYIVISLFLLTAFTFVAIQAERQSFSQIERMLSNRIQRPVLSEILERRLFEFSSDFRERLLYFDVILFLVATAASWFLSGKTLEPVEEMVKKQEEFSADASHELRTPLTSIIMEIEATKRTQKKIPKHIDESLNNIKEEALRMKHLVNNLLILVRSSSGATPAFTTFSINSAAEEAFDSLKNQAHDKHLEFIYEKCSPINIRGNKEAIKQMFIVLLDNAIKFTPSGSVTIRIVKEGNLVKVDITDTGIGIPSKDLTHIFERFYRVHTRTNSQGTGLGLAIAKKIAEEHRGKIAVISKLDGGSVFTITLPVSS